MNKIIEAIENLQKVSAANASKDAVSISVFITSEGFQYEVKHRAAESLRQDGISMRNLAGEFIKTP